MIFPIPEGYVYWASSCSFQLSKSIPDLPLCYLWNFHIPLDKHISRSQITVIMAQVPEIVLQMVQGGMVEINAGCPYTTL